MAKTSKSSSKNYDLSAIESKWQSKWLESGTYQPDLANAKKPFYNLMMFPYPSAEGLHSGNVFAFTGADVYGRFKRMQGNDVFEPIGLDGFGIHSENHALKTGTHPMEHAKRTQENFYRQLHSIGNSYAWKNKVETYDPAYYKWTQWLFIELFKAGLAYKKKSPVNFCPSCKTVLADEQVIEARLPAGTSSAGDVGQGKCERCNSVVEKKDLEQWFFKITDYVERLLGNIEGLNWTEKVKTAQRNWIGKKKGVQIKHKVVGMDIDFETFSAYPAWSWADTFIVIAPEHPLVEKLVKGTKHEDEVIEFVEEMKKTDQDDRTAEKGEKKGIFTGKYAKDPFGGEDMPIWLANFALMDFGTGIIRCSGHDLRDIEFAAKYDIKTKEVVDRINPDEPINAHDNKGILKNSGPFTGKDVGEVVEETIEWMEKQGVGRRVSTYHLRDWLISRQRYWGPPIPMIYCDSCAKEGRSWFSSDEAKKRNNGMGISNDKLQISNKKIGNWKLEIGNSSEAMKGWFPAEDLPVELPYIEDYKPMGTGKAPLANYPEFYEVKCPHCGGKATRETDVSDTFLDSAWYFLRYTSTDVDSVAFDKLRVKKWLPVTAYIGGAEHSVLHLLYARFVTMVLKDLGYIDFEEPFARFYAHGLIIKDGAKMSKSKGNVINPDEYIKKFGADAVRCYLLFLGPFNQGGDFRDTGMEGMAKFLKRVWVLFSKEQRAKSKEQKLNGERKSMMHETIKLVTEDFEELRYNTAIAKLMTYYNFLVKQDSLSHEEIEVYLKLLAPFAPHMTEELFHILGSKFKVQSSKFESIHLSQWPTHDEKLIVHDVVNLAVQVNGKLRGVLVLDQNSPKDEKGIQDLAKNDPTIAKFLEGKSIKKVIYVVGKILSFVVS